MIARKALTSFSTSSSLSCFSRSSLIFETSVSVPPHVKGLYQVAAPFASTSFNWSLVLSISFFALLSDSASRCIMNASCSDDMSFSASAVSAAENIDDWPSVPVIFSVAFVSSDMAIELFTGAAAMNSLRITTVVFSLCSIISRVTGTCIAPVREMSIRAWAVCCMPSGISVPGSAPRARSKALRFEQSSFCPCPATVRYSRGFRNSYTTSATPLESILFASLFSRNRWNLIVPEFPSAAPSTSRVPALIALKSRASWSIDLRISDWSVWRAFAFAKFLRDAVQTW
ncbi:MAG: hypothetical protein BWY66_02662 [bacterium ADurb.Bin374]|nr:MAG: hypothetical protein BWY66_02662 [bacterium ADurb.Bin374]